MSPETRTVADNVLLQAHARLREELAAHPFPSPESDVLLQELDTVASVAQACLAGDPPQAPGSPRADRVGLLDALRARVVEAWPGEGEAAFLPVARALEAARAHLGDGAGPFSPGTLTPYGYRLMREVAHTLRSPMGSLVMLAGSLRDGMSGEVNALQRKHLGIIHRAATSLAHMANDLLSLAGEDDGLRDDPEAFDVDGVLSTVADVVGPVAADRNLEVSVRCGVAGFRVGRPRPLTRGLTNLALNAALLGRDGALELVADGEGDDVVRFSVRAPVGAESGDPWRVFESPEGAESYTLSRSGLGFSVGRHLVRRMDSEVEALWSAEGGLLLSFPLRLPQQV